MSLYHDGASEHTPMDARWHSAAARRGIWTYSHIERLDLLMERVRELEGAIYRRLCETESGSPGEWSLRDRRDRLHRRYMRLSSAARKARRAEKEREQLARAISTYERTHALLGSSGGMRDVDSFLATLPRPWGGHEAQA